MSKRIPCPLCGTEGRLYETLPYGFWNNNIGTWEPAEEERTCPLCHGRCYLRPHETARLSDYRNADGTWDKDALEWAYANAVSHVDEPDPDHYGDREYSSS